MSDKRTLEHRQALALPVEIVKYIEDRYNNTADFLNTIAMQAAKKYKKNITYTVVSKLAQIHGWKRPSLSEMKKLKTLKELTKHL